MAGPRAAPETQCEAVRCGRAGCVAVEGEGRLRCEFVFTIVLSHSFMLLLALLPPQQSNLSCHRTWGRTWLACSTHVYVEMNFPGESAGKRTSSSRVSREIRHHDDTDSIGTNKSVWQRSVRGAVSKCDPMKALITITSKKGAPADLGTRRGTIVGGRLVQTDARSLHTLAYKGLTALVQVAFEFLIRPDNDAIAGKS